MSDEAVKSDEPVKSDGPVKVKMTLRAARPTVGGTSSPAAVAVESVEARLKKESEERSANKENGVSPFRKLATGCIARLMLVSVLAGCVWYFFGEKFLLPKYTFPQVWQQLQRLCK